MSNGVAGKAFSGTSDYTGLWLGNIAEPYDGDDAGESLMSKAFRRLTKDPVPPTQVTVQDGAPFLVYGTYSETTAAFPNGVTVTVEQPDGTLLDTASPLDSANPVSVAPNGSAGAFIIQSPMPGTWTFTVTAAPGADPFQTFVTTLPNLSGETADLDMEATLDIAFPELTDPAIWASEDFSLTCVLCQASVWAIGVMIWVTVTAGVLALTPESAIVVALVSLSGFSARAVQLFLGALMGASLYPVGIICSRICAWMNQC